MSNQPIPKAILEKGLNINNIDEITYTLLVDGSSLLKTCMVDDKINNNGFNYGPMFQTLLQLKMILQKRDFNYVYFFLDGSSSGLQRFELNMEYKSNRDKTFDLTSVNSEYYKQIDKFVAKIYEKRNKTIDPKKLTEKEIFFKNRDILIECLEELFIRTITSETVESDDFIAYYCKNKKPNDRVYIVTGDMDLTQLLHYEYTAIYLLRLKKFITKDNFYDYFNYHPSNVLNLKILTGDNSDCIKGIKQLSKENLLDNIMPEFRTRPVELSEVIDRCKSLQEERISQKKKPLQVYDNVINGISSSVVQDGEKFYEVNKKIIDLLNPLMTDDAIELMDDMMYAPIDPDGRNMKNLFQLIQKYNITELLDSNKFSNFFSTFNKTIEKEKKLFENSLK